jgi:hypothetical protein
VFFKKSIPLQPREIHQFVSVAWSSTRMYVFAAFMAAIAAILQSAGGFLPGIGYFFSPFATLPILFSMLVSLRSGVLSYLLTSAMLLFLQPSELVIYPFTTGILGLSLGWTVRTLHRRLEILLANSAALTIGICLPLYGLAFPVLGPSVPSSFSMIFLLGIFVFAFLYSWFWLEFSLFLVRRLKKIWLFSQ